MATMTAARALSPAVSAPVTKSSFAGKKVRAAKVAAVGRGKVAFSVVAERPLYFPGNPPPAYLDGSLPGDFGFDPLGLGSVPANLRWYVQAELVHCRWAMLGASGILIQEVLRSAGILPPGTPRWDLAGTADIYTLGLDVQIIVLIFSMGFAEGKRWADINDPGSVSEDPIFKGNKVTGKDLGYPGFDPLGLGSGSPDAVAEWRLKEIKNGRLAMLACLGFFVQAAYTDKGPLENLGAHLADPLHNNFIESLFA